MKKVLLIISIAGSLASCNNYGGDDDDYGWKGEPKDSTKTKLDAGQSNDTTHRAIASTR